jgi:hypothetical protein
MNAGPGTVPSSSNPVLGAGDGSCLQCHTGPAPASGFGRFPAVSQGTSGYCSTILRRARDRGIMPPFPTTASYAKHWDALQMACAQPAPSIPPTMRPTERLSPGPEQIMAVISPLLH